MARLLGINSSCCAVGAVQREAFYYLFVSAHKNMLMFLFEALLKCLGIVYIKSQNIFNSEKKNENQMRQPSILPVSGAPELFWDHCCCSLLWGYCSFVLDFVLFHIWFLCLFVRCGIRRQPFVCYHMRKQQRKRPLLLWGSKQFLTNQENDVQTKVAVF